MEKKKVGLFTKVTNYVTQTTPEERIAMAKRRADQKKAERVAMQMARDKELASYRKERVAQASKIGQERAKLEAKQKLKMMSQPKAQGDMFSNRMDAVTRLANFDSGYSIGSGASTKALSINDVVNMKFTDYGNVAQKKSQVKSMVKKKMAKRRVKHRVKRRKKK